jgi:AraC-like DNA-binding protein
MRANRMATPLSDNYFFTLLNYTQAKFTFPIHFHPEYELKLVLKANGKGIIGDSIRYFKINDLVLIGPNTPHVWMATPIEKHAHVITIHFNANNFLNEAFLGKMACLSLKELLLNSKRGVLFSKETIQNISLRIISLSNETKGFPAMLKFLNILFDLSNSKNQKLLASESYKNQYSFHKNERIQKIIDFIENNFRDAIRIEEVAKSISLSPTAFSHFFKKYTSRSFSDYLIDYRIGYASNLLVNTEKNISNICYDSGFNNLSNFNRAFKSKRGCTPKAFRERYNNHQKIF